MGESRNDIINWANNLLQLNVSKIEMFGTGSIYCQIIDSIYGKLFVWYIFRCVNEMK